MSRLKRTLYDVAVLVACALALVLAMLRPLRRLVRRRQFSLWAGTPIINMATNARAERLLGCESRSLVYETYFLTQAFDYDLSRLSQMRIIRWVAPLGVFIWACFLADRLHFYCDRGLLPSPRPFTFDIRELIVYRLIGIPVLLWTYGADVRTRGVCQSMGEPNCCTRCDAPGRYCLCDDAIGARNQARLRRWATAIFAGVGDMFPYTPGSIDDVFFWPVDLDAEGGQRYAPRYPVPDPNAPLRIVHSSNHRLFKGTDDLVAAVEALRRDGLNIDLVLVERVPNRQALELYQSADLIFDQCLMGNYGYFAIEGMALGKPVMCFVRKPAEYLLDSASCPLINTHVATLKDDLRRIYDNRAVLTDLGHRGRTYVEKHFSMHAFARRLAETYAKLGVQA